MAWTMFCMIKSVNFSYSLTTVAKETQSQRVRKTLTGPTLLPGLRVKTRGICINRRDSDLDPGPSAPESSTLTTRLPACSYPRNP